MVEWRSNPRDPDPTLIITWCWATFKPQGTWSFSLVKIIQLDTVQRPWKLRKRIPGLPGSPLIPVRTCIPKSQDVYRIIARQIGKLQEKLTKSLSSSLFIVIAVLTQRAGKSSFGPFFHPTATTWPILLLFHIESISMVRNGCWREAKAKNTYSPYWQPWEPIHTPSWRKL